MALDPLLLSRIQFAFVVSFRIVFWAFTIGIAARLATIEGMSLASGNPVYRRFFTIANAAAPEKSLSCLFWGAGAFVLPVIAIYTAVAYWLFRGKLRKGYG